MCGGIVKFPMSTPLHTGGAGGPAFEWLATDGSAEMFRRPAQDGMMDGVSPLALCPRGSSDALIRHTAFTPLEDDDVREPSRIARTESASTVPPAPHTPHGPATKTYSCVGCSVGQEQGLQGGGGRDDRGRQPPEVVSPWGCHVVPARLYGWGRPLRPPPVLPSLHPLCHTTPFLCRLHVCTHVCACVCTYVCMRVRAGAALAWGRGDLGQLMQPAAGASSTPVPVARLDSSRVVTVACSPYHTIVVTDTGELYAAGT